MLKKVSSYFMTMLFNVLKRFPIASLMLFLSFAAVVSANHFFGYSNRSTILRVSLQAFTVFPLMVAIQIFCENHIYKKQLFYKVLLSFSAIGFTVLYFFYFFTKSDRIELIRCFSLFIIFTATAMILLSYKNKNFSVNLIKLSVNFFLSFLYSNVLMLGLIGFFLITRTLLFPKLDRDIIQDIIAFSTVIFAPMFFMAGIPDRNSNNDELNYPLILKFIIKYLAIPFSFCYMGILYLYFAKSLISLSIPKGVIVHIVIWFSIGCFVVLAYISALLKESKSAVLYNKIVPKLLIPVLLFMFYSLYLRIRDYGFTESRYFILITGLFLFGFMIYASFAKNIKWKAVFLALIIFTFISAFSPLNAFKVSISSQNRRFEEILQRNNMIINGKIKPSDKISSKDKSELFSIFNYFRNFHSLQELKLFPKNLKSEDYIEIFGFSIDSQYLSTENESVYLNYQSSNRNNFIIDSSEYDFIILFEYMFSDTGLTVENNKYKSVLNTESKIISIYTKSDNSLIYSFDIKKAVIQKLKENRESGGLKYLVPSDSLIYTDLTKSGISVTYRFNNISGTYYPQTDKYDNVDFQGVLIQVKLSK